MVKKIIISSISFILIGTLVLSIALGIRLSKGPISLDFAKGILEERFQEFVPSGILNYNNLMLDWSSKAHTLVIQADDILVQNAKKVYIIEVPRVKIGFYLPNLLFGIVTPSTLEVYRPQITLSQLDDKSLTLDLTPHYESKENHKEDDINIIANLNRGLHHIEIFLIEDASIAIDSQFSPENLAFPHLNLSLHREGQHLKGDFKGILEIDHDPLEVFGDLDYHLLQKNSLLNLHFMHLDTSLLQKHIPELRFLSYLEADFKGKAALKLSPEFNIDRADLSFNAAEATFNIPEFYKAPLKFDSINLKGSYKGQKDIVRIEEVLLKKADYIIRAGGTAQVKKGKLKLNSNVFLKDFPLNELKHYWPEIAHPPSRNWVVKNIPHGRVDLAWLLLNFDYNLEKNKLIALKKLEGEINASDLTIHYYNELPKITNLSMHSTFNQEGFKFYPEYGKIGPHLKIKTGEVIISGLNQAGKAHISIDAEANSSLKAALNIIDHKPLFLLKNTSLKKNAMAGKALTHFHLDFPLGKPNLTFDDFTFDIQSKLTALSYQNFYPNLSITKGSLDLSYKKNLLVLNGPLSFNQKPQKITLNFKEDLKNKEGNIILSGRFHKSFFKPFIPEIEPYIQGFIPATIQLHNLKTLGVKADLTDATLLFPNGAILKDKKHKASLSFDAVIDKNRKLKSLKNFNLSGDKNLKLQGEYQKYKANDWRINIHKARFAQSNFFGSFSLSPGQKYKIKLIGESLDLTPFLNAKAAEGHESIVFDPLELDIALSRLTFNHSDKAFFSPLNASLSYDGIHFKTARIRGKFLNKRHHFALDYIPNKAGDTFSFKTDNVGKLLAALAISKAIYGGQVQADGLRKDAKEPLPITLEIAPYKVGQAPFLMRLVNLITLSSFTESLTENHIKFEGGQGENLLDDKNMELLIKKFTTKGPSLALTASGRLQFSKNLIDIHGMLAPAQTVNKIFNAIPILSNLFSDKGKTGLIAFSYRVKGSFLKPNFSVNPLTTLVPGFIRELFN